MLAVFSFVAFLIGWIVRWITSGFDPKDVWFWLLLGLALLALHVAVSGIPSSWWPRRNG